MWLRTIQIMKLAFTLFFFVIPLTLLAQSTDSIKVIQLKDVEIEAQLHSITASVSTYYPTIKQKNASFSGIDLLNRMAIPQLSLSMGNSVTTVSNQQVQLFIDGIPATNNDIKNMRIADVKKIEYYDYPADPRFMGSSHVINFIMKKYEYGGYFKTSLSERFIANDGNLNLFGKFTTDKFTFNIGLGGSYLNSKHNYTENSETYRLYDVFTLDQPLHRTENVSYAKKFQNILWPTVQIIYSSNKVSINNTLGASFEHTPTNDLIGEISYNPDIFTDSKFSNNKNYSEKSISYSGNWNFTLGNGNSISFNPTYSYSKSKQTYIYNDDGFEFNNYATDGTHASRSTLQFSHLFPNRSRFNLFFQEIFYHSQTNYRGTTNSNDKLTTYRIGPGLSYGIPIKNCYIYAGVGLNHDKTKYGNKSVNSTEPWADLSFQYSLKKRHRLSTEYHYMTTIPLSSHRSEAIINSHPLFSYTGNPNLTPYKSLDYGVSYTFIPNNRYSLSVFANGYSVFNRYAFVYKPYLNGILRSIEQPCGGFTSLLTGLNGRLYLLKRHLQLYGQIVIPYCYNGEPFNAKKTHINYTLRALWYFGDWNIGLRYVSENGQTGTPENGLWSIRKNMYSLNIGWGNQDWNVSASIANPFTWNWISATNIINSQYYDSAQTSYNPDNHCYIKVNISYTVGFGKKIKRNGEVTRQNGAGSAILE